MNYIIYYTESGVHLAHHGVKGMRWGVRHDKKPVTAYSKAKAAKKEARKESNKSYNRAHNYSTMHLITQFTNKKTQAESNKRWNDYRNKAKAYDAANKNYKKAKEQRKTAINNTHKSINKKLSTGEKMFYNDATLRKAAKYVVDRDMSVEDALKRAKKDARRNTAAVLALYGGYRVLRR